MDRYDLGVGYETDPTAGSTGQELTNLAPSGIATQSSLLAAFVPDLAIDGLENNFTHTLTGENLPAWWQVDLGELHLLEQINLHNRADCCQSRLRDITVEVLDENQAIVFTSALLNPENSGYIYPTGPATLSLDLVTLHGGAPVIGQTVRIIRTPDPDLSGTDGHGNSDEADVLSLSEVEIFGRALFNYDQLYQADLLDDMFEETASVYLRIPFNIDDDPTLFDQLVFQVQYDDGFVTYLNGTKIAEPTPGSPNNKGYLGFVADTQFSVDRGFYEAPLELFITSTTPGAEIYYTTDGLPPTPETGTLYTAPLTISTTTTLRAAAYKEDYLPTNTDTQTYLFLDDVLQQDYQATLAAGFPTSWGSWTPDYGMDSDVIGTFDASGNPLGGDLFEGIYAATIQADLLSIPTMSIVMDIDDLFGTTGIYTNSTERGFAWERPTSIELIYPDGTEGFQVDAGLRIQGGYFRQNSASRKHSFRLLFRDEYGPTLLQYPLFGYSETTATEFDTIVLRAGANDGYAWDAARYTEQYTRDEFGRSLQLATGNPSPHGTFVHLYINGIYWGLYNPIERPDNDFSASYFGGDPDNWDAVHVSETTEGDFVAWNAMLALTQQAGSSLAAYMELQGLDLDGTPDPTTAPLLDIQNYIDYITVNVWGGNWDWPWKNWWAGRDRDETATTGFKFYNYALQYTSHTRRMDHRTRLDTRYVPTATIRHRPAGIEPCRPLPRHRRPKFQPARWTRCPRIRPCDLRAIWNNLLHPRRLRSTPYWRRCECNGYRIYGDADRYHSGHSRQGPGDRW